MSILIYFATIFWSLFPNLIHVFQSGDNFINKVNATNLVVNGQNINVNFDDYANLIQYITIENNTLYYAYVDYSIIANEYTGAVGRLSIEDGHRFLSPSSAIFEDGFNHILSGITLTTEMFENKRLYIYGSSTLPSTTTLKSVYIYNVSQMIDKGVKNDSGISFSDLTDLEIQQQLDLWITEYGNLDFVITKDNTNDQWFNSGFVEKAAERDFLDYLGYFVWLFTPPIILFATLDLLRRVI